MTTTAMARSLRQGIADHTGLVVVVAVALAVRLVYGLVFVGDYFPLGDDLQYYELATSVSQGDGVSMLFPSLDLHPSAFRPPLYPLVLGGSMALFGDSPTVGQVLNLMIGLVVVALAWEVTRRLAGSRAALVAALLVAVLPSLVANDFVLLTEPLSLALLLGSVLYLFDHRWLGAGVATGLLVLTRPSAQFLVVAFAAWLLWRVGWRRALGFLAVTALVVAPWIGRNWIRLGEPVLVTSNGFNMAAIYSPEAQAVDGFVDPVYDDRFERYRLLMADELAWSQEMQRYGLSGLRQDPLYVLRVVQRNTIGWFELDPAQNEWAEERDGRDLDLRRATLWSFYLVTVVGWFGLGVRWRDPRVVLLMGIALYFTAGSLVLVSPPRLRAPFDLISCIGVGLAVAWRGERRNRRNRRDQTPIEPTGDAEDTDDEGSDDEAVRARARP